MPGRVERLWVKRSHRGPMDARDRVTLRAGHGIVDNADRSGRRQVTIISTERWETLMAELHDCLDPSARRANVLVTGVDLRESRGRTLRIGACRLRVGGETRPCERMDDASFGLRVLMERDWGGGAYAEVLDDGEIAVGNDVQWEDESSEEPECTMQDQRAERNNP